MPYETLDLVLYAALNNIPADIAAAVIGLSVEQIERAWKDLKRKRKTTETLRMLPPSPELSP